jgi:hypothetical protein
MLQFENRICRLLRKLARLVGDVAVPALLDEKDPFLCNACSFCKFELTLSAKAKGWTR